MSQNALNKAAEEIAVLREFEASFPLEASVFGVDEDARFDVVRQWRVLDYTALEGEIKF